MLTRRGFLARAAAGVVLVGAGQVLLTAPNAAAAPVVPGYGPLRDDPDGLLALPAGFSYRLVTAAGRTRLESGEPTPGFHDGTGAFARRGGGTLLVVNHEIREPLADAEHPVPPLDGLTYDPAMAGGATIVEADARGARLREVVGLAGTSTNCAGGITPWRTWLSCEETETREGEGGAQHDHGHVFEVDPYTQAANREPRPRPDPCAGPVPARGRRRRPRHGRDLSHRGRRRPERPALPLVAARGFPSRPRSTASARPGRRAARRDALQRTARAGRSTISHAPPRSARATPSSGSRWTTGRPASSRRAPRSATATSPAHGSWRGRGGAPTPTGGQGPTS